MLSDALGPLEWLARWHPWWVLLLTAVVFFDSNRAMRRISDARLLTSVTPKGPILKWEMAGTKKRMDEILEAWGPVGRQWAGRTLLIDVPFLFAYGAVLSLACTMAALYFRGAHAVVGKWVYAVAAWVAVLTAALDLVEDAFLARMLRPFEGDGLPRTMTAVSKTKWVFGLTLVPFAIVAFVLYLVGCPRECG